MDKLVTGYNNNNLIINTLKTIEMDKHYYHQDNQQVLSKRINKLQGIHKYFSQDWSN